MAVNASETVKTKNFRVTVSSIQDLNCPRKFKDTRIDGNWGKREFIAAVSNGTAVHAVAHQLYAHWRGDGDIDMSHIDAIARDAVRGTRYPDDYDHEEAVGRVIASCYGFVSADDEEAIRGTLDLEREGKFDVHDRKTGELLFVASAKLDRTLIRASEPHRLVVRESKTTVQKLSLQETFLMLWVARRMYPDLGLTSWAVEYDFLDEDYRVNRETIDWEEARTQSPLLLRKVMRIRNATEYPAIPGPQCTYCRHRESCTSLTPEAVDVDEAPGELPDDQGLYNGAAS